MYIDLTNAQREEIISFLRQETIPARFEVQIYKDSFKRKARKFIYLCNTNELRYKKTSVQYLRFFTTQESVSKKDFILLQHNTNGHAGRDRLFGHIKNLAYVIARTDIVHVLFVEQKELW